MIARSYHQMMAVVELLSRKHIIGYSLHKLKICRHRRRSQRIPAILPENDSSGDNLQIIHDLVRRGVNISQSSKLQVVVH